MFWCHTRKQLIIGILIIHFGSVVNLITVSPFVFLLLVKKLIFWISDHCIDLIGPVQQPWSPKLNADAFNTKNRYFWFSTNFEKIKTFQIKVIFYFF